LTLYGDCGAKKVIQDNLSSMIKIKIQSNTIFKDYDTKESLESVAGVA